MTCTTHHDACECRHAATQQQIAALRAEVQRLTDRLCWIRAPAAKVLAVQQTITRIAADRARAGDGESCVRLTDARDVLSEALRVALDDLDESRLVAVGMRVVVAAARHVVTDCCDYADGCQRADSQPCVHCRLRWALDDLDAV